MTCDEEKTHGKNVYYSDKFEMTLDKLENSVKSQG
jgi:hypothetical protein